MMSTVIPLPGDFLVLPMGGLSGSVVAAAEALQRLVETRKLHEPLRYAHAEVYVDLADADGPHGYTYSTYPNRVGRRALPCPPGQVPGALWSTGVIGLTEAQRTAIRAWCSLRPAVPYSALDYVALTARTLGIGTGLLRGYISDQGHQICSQYVDAAYLSAGVHLFTDGRWPGFVTPVDLALLLGAKGVLPRP